MDIETSNLVDRLIVVVLAADDRSALKRAWSGYVNHLNFGGRATAGHQPYLWNGWSYNGQIL